MNWLDILKPIISKDGKKPLYLRLENEIRACIYSGRLLENDRLPPDRKLARLLKIDRSTVARAYSELKMAGLINSHVGRGTFVKASPAPISAAKNTCPIIWHEKFSRLSQIAASIVERQPSSSIFAPNVISFAGGTPTQEFFPHEEFQNIVSQLGQSQHFLEMFAYSQVEGQPLLRTELSHYLKLKGIQAREHEILILNGSQQGIDLVARTFLDANDVVVLEDPTYFWAICNFSAIGGRLVPIPVDDGGIKLDVLETVISRQRAKLLYVMPSFQNPTGTTISLEKRKKLLELANFYQVPVLEDNFVGDLWYDGQPLPTLKSLDISSDTVIYQGTFSKALCPGLRLGWMVAPSEVMSRLSLAKRTCDLSTNSMAQIVVAEFLRSGFYEKHLAHVRSAYQNRLNAMCRSLTNYVSSEIAWSKPQGGMFVWAKLPKGYSSQELLVIAEKEGVTFSPGEIFFVTSKHKEYFRLSFIQLSETNIEQGIMRLAKAIKLYLASRKRLAKGASYLNYTTSGGTLI